MRHPQTPHLARRRSAVSLPPASPAHAVVVAAIVVVGLLAAAGGAWATPTPAASLAACSGLASPAGTAEYPQSGWGLSVPLWDLEVGLLGGPDLAVFEPLTGHPVLNVSPLHVSLGDRLLVNSNAIDHRNHGITDRTFRCSGSGGPFQAWIEFPAVGVYELTDDGTGDRIDIVVDAAAPPPPPPPTCAANLLCLQSGRFTISAAWTDGQGNHGVGTPVAMSGETGYFWFFSAGNVEAVVKVLDGRALNGKFWVLYGALSNVAYTLTVADTTTGTVKTYQNPQGKLASVADTSAF